MDLNKQITPYTVPDGYFESLPGIVMSRIKASEDPVLEIDELSSLLGSIGKKNVYKVPEGYFETLSPLANRKAPTTVVRMNFTRYVAAALVVGVIAIATWFVAMPPKPAPVTTAGQILEKVESVPDSEMEKFMQASVASYEQVVVAGDDIRDEDIILILSEVPDTELETYIN